MRRIHTLGLVITFLISGFLKGQGFAGTIEFKYATQKDTTLNLYSVKQKKVRLDQFHKKNNNIEGSYLFDLETGDVKFLTPKRKLWGTQKSETPKSVKGTCVVTKGTIVKTIVGVKCAEYTVKNSAENTVITYWVAEGKYNFFIPLLQLWNRPDKQSIYFSQIKNLPEGSMPMMSEEKQLTDGKLLTKLEVTKINNTAPPDATFEIPAGYSSFGQ